MPAVDLPDVEAMAVEFSGSKTTADTGTWVKQPARYVRVWRTGGAAVNRVLERAQITVTCGAKNSGTENGSTIASRDANALRHAFLNDYTEMPLVRGVAEVAGLYSDPDPDTGDDRYTFTVELMVRAAR